jgi:hypothetical protein
MPEPHEGPDSLEGMAFQLLLQKVTGLERAMQSIPPLLKKIIDQLEAQTTQPDVEVATYAQLYPELEGETPEAAATADTEMSTAGADNTPALPVRRRRRPWHWFLREGA